MNKTRSRISDVQKIMALPVLVLICAFSALGQDAREILRASSEACASVRTYDFKGDAEYNFTMDDVRYALKGKLEMARGDSPEEARTVRFLSFAFDCPVGEGVKYPASFSLDFPYDFARFASNVSSATPLRQEPLEINGKPAVCYVIQVQHAADRFASVPTAPPPETIWIDKASHFILRIDYQRTQRATSTTPSLRVNCTARFSSYIVNAPSPEWLINARALFEKRVADRKTAMTGKPADDMKLHDLQGREVSLSQLHDKIVLLDFWATWCAPCRAEISLLKKIEKDWSAKGLVVLRITDEASEDVERFQKSLKERFTAYADGSEALKKYGIQGRPTHIVIDRNGVISSYDESSLTETELVQRLKKAGLE